MYVSNNDLAPAVHLYFRWRVRMEIGHKRPPARSQDPVVVIRTAVANDRPAVGVCTDRQSRLDAQHGPTAIETSRKSSDLFRPSVSETPITAASMPASCTCGPTVWEKYLARFCDIIIFDTYVYCYHGGSVAVLFPCDIIIVITANVISTFFALQVYFTTVPEG